MTDPKDLEFLANKSKELIDKQIASHRQKHSNASSIIAIVSLFIPLFLGSLDDAFLYIKLFSLVPIALFVIAICILLFHVVRARPLFQALNFDKFDELVNCPTYEDVLLYEIGANRDCFKDNEVLTDTTNKYYNRAVVITILAIILSVSLLLLSKFNKPEKMKEPTQVEIVNKVSIVDSTKKGVDTVSIIKTLPPDPEPKKIYKKARNCCRNKSVIVNQVIQNNY